MSKAIEILNFEEGYREKPYFDTLGYPTVAGGIRIGPAGATLSAYQFTVPRNVGDLWKQSILADKVAQIPSYPNIAAALKNCNDARTDVIYSMLYQLGAVGLSGFKNTLSMIASGNFNSAADDMLNSLWARQTPARAKRHAQVMRDGNYDAYRGLI